MKNHNGSEKRDHAATWYIRSFEMKSSSSIVKARHLEIRVERWETNESVTRRGMRWTFLTEATARSPKSHIGALLTNTWRTTHNKQHTWRHSDGAVYGVRVIGVSISECRKGRIRKGHFRPWLKTIFYKLIFNFWIAKCVAIRTFLSYCVQHS